MTRCRSVLTPGSDIVTRGRAVLTPGGAIRTCGRAVVTKRGAIETGGRYGSCIGSYGSSSDLKGGGERSVVICSDMVWGSGVEARL